MSETQQQNGSDSDSVENISDVSELNVGDEVITSKGDAMDKKPLEVREIEEIDGSLTAIIQGSWANARKYTLVNSDKFGITMPDVGIITVQRVSEAEPEADGGEDTNDITQAYQMQGELNELAGQWEEQMQEAGGQIGANVSGSSGPTGNFQRGWHVDGTVEVSRTFTIPMDVPAWMIEQMKADFDELGASVDIDMSTSVTGRPPKQKESGVVIPRGPSQERIDAMDESEKTHTGKVTVTLDVTDQMQGLPEGMIIEGSRVNHHRSDGEGKGISFVKSHHGEDSVYIIPEDRDDLKGRVVCVDEGSLDLLQQFPEETEGSAWWHDI